MKLSVGVFFGGRSVEHEVSVISAVQAMLSMDRTRYNVHPFYLTKKGEIYTGEALLDIEQYKNMPALLQKCLQVTLLRRETGVVWAMRAFPKLLGSSYLMQLDVALPIVHGTLCEDGTLQGYFEMLQLPYAGCDVISSAMGMEKMVQKQILHCAGLPVLNAVCFHLREFVKNEEGVLRRVEDLCGYPVIVKPVNLGSSVGIMTARNRESLKAAITHAGDYAHRLLCERAIDPVREINCAVLGDWENAIPSLCEEPIAAGEILSYADKYLTKMGKQGNREGMAGASRRLPADLDSETEAHIRKLAVDAFRALGCSGVVRVDFLIDTDNDAKVYVNEVNTIPGSLSHYLFQPIGLDYPALIDRLIELAVKRQRERDSIVFSYDTNLLNTGSTLSLKGVGQRG